MDIPKSEGLLSDSFLLLLCVDESAGIVVEPMLGDADDGVRGEEAA